MILPPYNSIPVQLPASKSIGARYLVASYFAGTLEAAPRFDDCDDLKVIQQALLDLEAATRTPADASEPTVIDLHASGTALRFVAAAAASTPGAEVTLSGIERLMERPMKPLMEVLRAAGATIEPLGANGCGPYRIRGRKLRGGEYMIKGDISSQFISALMLAAPMWEGGITLRFTTPLVSRPYAEMTLRVMEAFGIRATLSEKGATVGESSYAAPSHFKVEADWSAAAFFYEAASFRQSPIKIAWLTDPDKSLQGDAVTAGLYRRGLGLESEFTDEGALVGRRWPFPDELNANLTHYPDLVPALAVSCLFNCCRFRFTGVRNLRLKESDRLAAIKTELEKFGHSIEVGDDFISWKGGGWPYDKDFVVETYGDHRIAMAFAIGACRMGRIRIANPDVVEKSYANFWEQLPLLGLRCSREGDVMIVEDERILNKEERWERETEREG